MSIGDRFSPSSRRLYNQVAGDHDEPDHHSTRLSMPQAAGPTMIKVRDPLEDLEAVVELYDEADPQGKRRNAFMRRQKKRLALTDDGQIALGGRLCCTQLARRIDRQLHRMRLPVEHTCPECGTVWRVEMRVREERRHAF